MKGFAMNATETRTRKAKTTKTVATARPVRDLSFLSDDEQRLYSLLPESMDFVDHESFGLAATEEQLFGDQAHVAVPAWLYYSDQVDNVAAAGKSFRGLSHGDEQRLFMQYNYARYRVSLLLAAQARRFSNGRARELCTWFAQVLRLRSDVVNANLALVLAMARRTKVPGVDLNELVSEGNMALLRSIEKFDTSRGFKFSTYSCRAILKSFNRMATKTGRYSSRFPVEYDPDMEMGDNDAFRHAEAEEAMVEGLKLALEENRAELSDVERQVIIERYGLENDGKKFTLSQVGEHVGLTNERVRQLQNHGLRKLQRHLKPLL
jgi:RNA polymerase primary sigma factor